MDVNVVTIEMSNLEVDAHIIGVFTGNDPLKGDVNILDQSLDNMISTLVSEGEITGKIGNMTLLHTFGRIKAKHVLVIGLGDSEKYSLSVLRKIIARACRHLRHLGIASSVAVCPSTMALSSSTMESLSQSITEGIILGLYKYQRHFTTLTDSQPELARFTLLATDNSSLKAFTTGIFIGKTVAMATNLARDWCNEPSNYMTPSIMAAVAQELAKVNGLDIQVLERKDCEKLGMGGFLGVAKGSAEEPKFIVLKYNGDPTNKQNNLGLIGKSVTFDSGGISLKPAAGMGDMKGDMSGGAAVIAAIGAIAQLKPKINVTAIAAATENLPSGTAIKPGDVLTLLTGKTVEVENTDAEGRLTLADALGYARQNGINRLVDIATLTGAIVTSLGNVRAGVFGNNQKLIDSIIEAGETSGEKMWQLPMDEEYKELNKSSIADLKNTGGRTAGSITAAQFLAEFVGEEEWAHLDIAGVFRKEKDSGEFVKGATGIPVRLLVNLAVSIAEKA